MKLSWRTKVMVLISLASLYLSGVLTWVYQRWFFIPTTFGPEPSPMKVFWLETHSVLGLWFMIIFGSLYHSHMQPGWRRHKKRLSGGVFTLICGLLIVTVPGLFYLTQENLRGDVSAIHTYVGLGSALFFFAHYFWVMRG